MAGVLADVADAIVEEINSATLSKPIKAERSWPDWDEDLKDTDSIHVDVVAIGADIEQEDRESVTYSCTIHVGVRYKFKSDSNDNNKGRIAREDVDAMVLLVEEIGELFPKGATQTGILSDMASAGFEEFKTGMWFNRRHLRELQQFTGIVRVTQRVNKVL